MLIMRTILFIANNIGRHWRRGPESNRASRICNPEGNICTLLKPAWILGYWTRIQRIKSLVCYGYVKKTPRGIFAIMLSAALTACGGGGGGGSPAPSLQSAPIAQPAPVVTLAPVVKPEPVCTPVQPVKIQLFGDSTGGGALAALQDAMNIRFGTGAVQIEARAVSGTTAWQLLSGTDGLNLPWPKSVNADIIVINHGINDPYYEESADDYAYILGKLSAAPAIVVFQTPLPVKNGKPDFVEIMRQVAKKKNILLIEANAFAKSTPDWFARYVLDNVHPSPAGYALLADAVMYPVLMPIVAKLKCL